MEKNIFAVEVQQLFSIENLTKRRAYFISFLNRELLRRGVSPVLVVGGFAVEIYTAGNYSTGDVDIKGNQLVLEIILMDFGFVRYGVNNYGHELLGIYIHWLGEGPQPPFECKEKTTSISIGMSGDFINVISPEDIIIDRLCQAIHWKNPDGLLWAKAIFQSCKLAGLEIDEEYLESRARSEDVFGLIHKLDED